MTTKYSRSDLEKLKVLTKDGNPVHEHLLETNCSPEDFEIWMRNLPKQHKFIYQTDYKALPQSINDPSLQGFLKWRLNINK